MLYKDLPESRLIGYAVCVDQLVVLITETMGNNRLMQFSGFDRAVDGPRECWLISERRVEGLTETTPFEPVWTLTLAKDLFLKSFMDSVRFDPPTAPMKYFKKGWEVRIVEKDGAKCLIFFPAWARNVAPRNEILDGAPHYTMVEAYDDGIG